MHLYIALIDGNVSAARLPNSEDTARRRSAPTVGFISLEIFATGVRVLECAFKVRTSSFVQSLITRRRGFGWRRLLRCDFHRCCLLRQF